LNPLNDALPDSGASFLLETIESGKIEMKSYLTSIVVFSLLTSAAFGGTNSTTIIVESRKPDGSLNTPAWTEISGKWTPSKNKSRIAKRESSLTATNVSVVQTNVPVPAFKVTPTGLESGATYKVDLTFSTTQSFVAAPDLIVAVSTSGVAASTIPTNTPAFQGAGADEWNALGTITPATNSPTLKFTFVSGALAKGSRWHADAIRFTKETTSK
jgi:hypothetical protein